MNEEHSTIQPLPPAKPLKRIFQQLPWEAIFRWMLFLLGTAGLTALFPFGGASKYSDLKLNFINTKEIIAPFDFEILKSEEELEAERALTRSTVPPVFRREDAIERMKLTQLDSLLSDLHNLVFSEDFSAGRDSLAELQLRLINQRCRINLSGQLFSLDRELIDEGWWHAFKTEMSGGLGEAYDIGILDHEPTTLNTSSEFVIVIAQGIERRFPLLVLSGLSSAKKTILNSLKDTFSESDLRVKLGYEIILNFLEPNLIYDEGLTELRREESSTKVALAKGIVLKDERIIDSNERVTQVHLDKLRSLDIKQRELAADEGGIARIFPFFGKIILSAGLLFLFAFFVFHYRPELTSAKNFLLLLILLLTPLAFLQLLIEPAGISHILFPSALALMLATIFFGYRIGFWFLLVLSLSAGAMQGFDYFLSMLTLLVGSAGIVSVKSIRSRTQLLAAALYLLAAHIVFITAFDLLQFSFNEGLLEQLGMSIINSGMTPIFVLGFAIILGNIFDITTDLTLIELSDLNRPLLKQLAATAPGTYHHSLMVGTLAEAAAEAVGANPLLARTASYYHDIGKIEKRDYFIENQVVFNPHDTIPPEESARILNSHVRSGLEIADKHRLPQVIKDAITQHHGTGLMQYFYVKAKKKDGEVNREQYQYPGPLPFTKESGIIMLADSVEAAVRAMGQSTPEEIRERVKRIIENKFAEGQLDRCELSLRDLQTVEESFVKTFAAQSHQRIAYPSRAEIESLEHNGKQHRSAY